MTERRPDQLELIGEALPPLVISGDPLAGLTDPQREAVLHGEGPLLIVAGAGTRTSRRTSTALTRGPSARSPTLHPTTPASPSGPSSRRSSPSRTPRTRR